MKTAVIAALFALAFPATGQQSKSLEQIQREEALQKAIDTAKRVRADLITMNNQRRADCLKAVGYEPFCTCILNELPIAWSFYDYIAITTRSKEENGYINMDTELRFAYDKVVPIRDKCVSVIDTSP